MPSGLRQYAWDYLHLPHRLRDRSYQRQSLHKGVDEHRCGLLQGEERASGNSVINLGPALKPLLSELVLAAAIAGSALAEESSTVKEHLLYCEELVEHDEDLRVFRQYFEACITASY